MKLHVESLCLSVFFVAGPLAAWCQEADQGQPEPEQPAAKPAANLLVNGGFEEVDGATPEGWDLFLTPQSGAYGRIDSEHAYAHNHAAALHVPELEPQNPVNNWSQNIMAPVAGRTLRVSGHIRTEDATEAAIWIQCWSAQPVQVIHGVTTFQKTPTYGTRDWQRVEMAVDVPSHTSFVTCRCVLRGRGSAWFDDIQVVIDDTAESHPPDRTNVAPTPPAATEAVRKAAVDSAAAAAVRARANRSLRRLLAEPSEVGTANPFDPFGSQTSPIPWLPHMGEDDSGAGYSETE